MGFFFFFFDVISSGSWKNFQFYGLAEEIVQGYPPVYSSSTPVAIVLFCSSSARTFFGHHCSTLMVSAGFFSSWQWLQQATWTKTPVSFAVSVQSPSRLRHVFRVFFLSVFAMGHLMRRWSMMSNFRLFLEYRSVKNLLMSKEHAN